MRTLVKSFQALFSHAVSPLSSLCLYLVVAIALGCLVISNGRLSCLVNDSRALHCIVNFMCLLAEA